MPGCFPVHSSCIRNQGRFRFARACQTVGFPVLLPGMLVRRPDVAPDATGSDPQGMHYSIRSLCARSWIHWDAGRFGYGKTALAVLHPKPRAVRCDESAAGMPAAGSNHLSRLSAERPTPPPCAERGSAAGRTGAGPDPEASCCMRSTPEPPSCPKNQWDTVRSMPPGPPSTGRPGQARHFGPRRSSAPVRIPSFAVPP